MLTILLFIFLACWCWFGNGPYFLRWPAVVMVVVFTSGHPLVGALGSDFDALAGPLLTLFFALLGLTILLRVLFGHPGRNYHHHGRYRRHGGYGRRWHHDRW